MSRLPTVGIVAIILWISIPPSHVAQSNGLVQGVVRRSDTLAPISAVAVRITGPGAAMMMDTSTPPPQQNASTDFDGRFVFRDVVAGSYRIQLGANGFFGSNGAPSEYIDVTVNPATAPADLEVLLDPGATFSGRVVDSEGRPIPGVRVAYVSQDVRGLSVHYASGEFRTTTNAAGEYSIGWIPSGDYFLRAEFPGEESDRVNRTTYFPDSLFMSSARRVVAGPGGSKSGLDIQVQKAVASTVSGRILSPEVQPASETSPQLALILYPRDSRSPAGSAIGRVEIDQVSGRFQIRGVLPGRYELAAAVGPLLSAHMPVDVGDDNIDGLSLSLKPSMEIRGRILGLPSPQDSRLLINYEGGPIRPQGGTIDAQGNYAFSGAVEGSLFRLYPFGQAINMPDNYYIREMRQGTRDIMDSGAISFAEPAESLELVVSTGSGTVEGMVAGRKRSGDYVVLIPDGARRSNLALYRRARIDTGNRFTITGITPGIYKVFGWESFYPSPISLLDPEYMSRYEDRGTTVTVQEDGRVKDVRVNLIPAGQ